MKPREGIFAVLLAAAATLISVGVTHLSIPAGLIAAGVLLGGWAWLVLHEMR
jgi:hypothetical protein